MRERIGRSCGVAYLLWAVDLLFMCMWRSTGTRSIHWGVRSWGVNYHRSCNFVEWWGSIEKCNWSRHTSVTSLRSKREREWERELQTKCTKKSRRCSSLQDLKGDDGGLLTARFEGAMMMMMMMVYGFSIHRKWAWLMGEPEVRTLDSLQPISLR